MHPLRITSSRRVLFAVLMAATLVFAQWMGLQHRIEHSVLMYPDTAQIVLAASESEHDHDADHSCAVFDAATVADTMHAPPYAAPLMTSNQVLAKWAAFISWDAPLVLSFSSRAPPLA